MNIMDELDKDSLDMRGETLKGKYRHYCNEFDGLPVDENCFEFKFCTCFEDSQEIKDLQNKIELPT
jgi:hypothetical protein